jgi:hypothetical protein
VEYVEKKKQITTRKTPLASNDLVVSAAFVSVVIPFERKIEGVK